MYGDIVMQPANNNAGYLTLAMSKACVNKQLIVGGSFCILQVFSLMFV